MSKPPPPPRPPTEIQPGDLPVWLEVWLETPPGKALALALLLPCVALLTAALCALVDALAWMLS